MHSRWILYVTLIFALAFGPVNCSDGCQGDESQNPKNKSKVSSEDGAKRAFTKNSDKNAIRRIDRGQMSATSKKGNRDKRLSMMKGPGDRKAADPGTIRKTMHAMLPESVDGWKSGEASLSAASDSQAFTLSRNYTKNDGKAMMRLTDIASKPESAKTLRDAFMKSQDKNDAAAKSVRVGHLVGKEKSDATAKQLEMLFFLQRDVALEVSAKGLAREDVIQLVEQIKIPERPDKARRPMLNQKNRKKITGPAGGPGNAGIKTIPQKKKSPVTGRQ